MAERKYDVYGIGNALVDLLIEVEEHHLERLKLKKGNLHLMNKDDIKELLAELKGHKIVLAPGGSCANTISTIAKLGGKSVFCGIVGDDEYGNFYCLEMEKGKVTNNIIKSQGTTGHAVTLITPDTQRTFSVFLGQAIMLRKEHINHLEIAQSKILHIEGYLLEDKALQAAALKAMEIAKANRVVVSLDLGDPGLISRNIKDFKSIVQTYADILFLNEDEAKVFTGCDNVEDALLKASMMTQIVIIKLGKKGSLIKKGEKIIKIEPVIVNAVDTTGAGDNYAAGFLYGLTKKFDLKKCGELGSRLGAEIAKKIGARFDTEIDDIIKELN